ncbi:MAG: hypothetical protein IJK86_04235 [Lachnospiraceae bacterium]|nr:hypothetical protein [Lachnospiraceae bacterium]
MKNRKITSETIHDASAMLIREMMEDESANTVPMDLSPAFQNRMEELLQDRKVKEFKTHRSHRRAWMTAAMIAIVLFTWLAVDTKARAAVAEWFKSVIEDVFHYSFSGSAVDGTLPEYRLGWYPEGGEILVEEENKERGSYSIGIKYGETDVIHFGYGKYDEGLVIDVPPLNNEMAYSQFNIKGQQIEEYHRLDLNDYDYVWMDDKEMIYFTFFSTLDHETNIKIISNIINKR